MLHGYEDFLALIQTQRFGIDPHVRSMRAISPSVRAPTSFSHCGGVLLGGPKRRPSAVADARDRLTDRLGILGPVDRQGRAGSPGHSQARVIRAV